MKHQYAASVLIGLLGIGGMADVWASTSYTMLGRVTGLRAQNNSCYIAVNDRSAGGYSNAWHKGVGEVCNIAKMAFDNGRTVRIEAKVDPVKANTNDIQAIEMTWEYIQWPPYHP